MRGSERGRRLSGKVCVVTGAGRGIGRAVALAFAREGGALALCARTLAELEETAAEAGRLGADVILDVCDVTQPEQVEAFVALALKQGRVDVLVNNAGIGDPGTSLANTSPEAWDRVMAVNLRGPFLFARAVLPAMTSQRSGSLINVSSRLGRIAGTTFQTYGVSKWGLEGLTRYLAAEVAPFGIRVNSVSPGLVATRLNGFVGAPPESVTELFVFLASDAAAHVTGMALDVASWQQEIGAAAPLGFSP